MTTKMEPHDFISVLFLSVWSSPLAGPSDHEAAPLLRSGSCGGVLFVLVSR